MDDAVEHPLAQYDPCCGIEYILHSHDGATVTVVCLSWHIIATKACIMVLAAYSVSDLCTVLICRK